MGEKYYFYGPCFLDKEDKVMKKGFDKNSFRI